MKKILTLLLISSSINSFAQVPSYVPTNGLVGYWPFTGNANDVSGNGNNGTVSAATLTTDRFGNANGAYSFNGTTSYIGIPTINVSSSNQFTISIWVNPTDITGMYNRNILRQDNGIGGGDWLIAFQDFGANLSFGIQTGGVYSELDLSIIASNYINAWHNIIVVYDGSNRFIYSDNVLIGSDSKTGNVSYTPSATFVFGAASPAAGAAERFIGKIDDIGIWSYALNQQEIADVYNSVNCSNNTAISPQINTLQIGNTAIFTASTSDPNPSYVWQSDFGQGFQTLNNFGNYSGANTATFNISNVQLSEHNQPIRVISTSGNCIDTSNVALINITDTCVINVYDTLTTQVFDTTFVTQTVYDTLYVTVYDTLLTTVTDTLIINATLVGLNPPNNLNTLKIYPNPTSTHITINYGNFIDMNGYLLKIVNNIGQTIFTTPINMQTSYIDLSTWTGNGIYFVQLIDPQNNTIENRKIVIQ